MRTLVDCLHGGTGCKIDIFGLIGVELSPGIGGLICFGFFGTDRFRNGLVDIELSAFNESVLTIVSSLRGSEDGVSATVTIILSARPRCRAEERKTMLPLIPSSFS